MPMEPDFRMFMTTPFTVEHYQSRDGYGNPQFGAPKTIYGYFERDRIDRGSGGARFNTVTTETEEALDIIVDDKEAWDTFDRITLPDGRKPEIVNVEMYYDQNGLHHQVLECQQNRR